MSKKRPNKQVTEKRKAKNAKKAYYASDAAKRKWEEKKARKKCKNNSSGQWRNWRLRMLKRKYLII